MGPIVCRRALSVSMETGGALQCAWGVSVLLSSLPALDVSVLPQRVLKDCTIHSLVDVSLRIVSSSWGAIDSVFQVASELCCLEFLCSWCAHPVVSMSVPAVGLVIKDSLDNVQIRK